MIDPLPPISLRRFPIVDTNSPDEMRDALVCHYGASDFDLRQTTGQFRAMANLLRLRNTALSYCNYSADVHVTLPGDNWIRQYYALSGSGQVTFGRSQFSVSANETGVVPGVAQTDFSLDNSLSMVTLRLEEAALRVKLSALIGTPVGSGIDFSPTATFQNPQQLRLRRFIQFFLDQVDGEHALPNVAFVEFEQTMMVIFLVANTHNFSHLLEDRPASAAPWQVRVVEDYIAANWSRPITIEALAEATGVGIRSMFKTFRDARGCSPMSFLRHIRLQHARRMLQAPDEATSVTAVGFSCGFQSLGHFARDYRAAFNELPSATLAMAKGMRRSAATS